MSHQCSPAGPAGLAGAACVRSVSGFLSVAGALVIWVVLLGPVITLFTHLSGSSIASSLTAPGALQPLVTSLESGGVTLAVLFFLCTPLAWMLAHGRLPFPLVFEAGILCSLLLPPLVIGLLLVFMVGPYTPFGELIAHFNLSATNTFLALVIAEVYESAPYYVSALRPRSRLWTRVWSNRRHSWETGRAGCSAGSRCRWRAGSGHGACRSLGTGRWELSGLSSSSPTIPTDFRCRS